MEDGMQPKINHDRVVTALGIGLAPAEAVPLLHVGRQQELADLAADNEMIADGGSSMRFVVGDIGAGKTHLRIMHTAQSAQQNIVTAVIDGLRFDPEEFPDIFSLGMWRHFILSLEIGHHRGLHAIIDELVASLQGDLLDQPSLLFQRFFHEVPECAHDVLKMMIQFVWARAKCDECKEHDALSWLVGNFESRIDVVRAMAITSLIQDASWIDRMYHLACVLRVFGYSGLSVQVEYIDGSLMDVSFHHRIESTYKLIKLADDCARHRYSGLGFVVYIECSTASMIGTELEFCNERLDERFEWGGSDQKCMGMILLGLLSPHEVQALLLNVGRLCFEAPRISQAFRGTSVEGVVDAFLSGRRHLHSYPGPCIVEFVHHLWTKASTG
jgi:hypothetical protein